MPLSKGATEPRTVSIFPDRPGYLALRFNDALVTGVGVEETIEVNHGGMPTSAAFYHEGHKYYRPRETHTELLIAVVRAFRRARKQNHSRVRSFLICANDSRTLILTFEGPPYHRDWLESLLKQAGIKANIPLEVTWPRHPR